MLLLALNVMSEVFNWQLEVKLTSGVHLAVVQASRCRLLQLCTEQSHRDMTLLIAASVDAEPVPPLAPAFNHSACTSS